MHQRAISFIVSKASPATSQPTFSLALQAAAARAWSRQVSARGPGTNGVRSRKYHTGSVLPQVVRHDLLSPSASCNNLSSNSVAPDPTSCRKARAVCVPEDSNLRVHSTISHDRQSSPDITSKASITQANHRGNRSISNRIDRLAESDVNGSIGTPSVTKVQRASRYYPPEDTISPIQPTIFPEHDSERGRKFGRNIRFTRPSTPHAFSQNLMRLVYYTKPLPPLPTIIDYHNLHPTLHSTHSYNIVLDVMLQHNAFAPFRSLLQAMQHSRVERNLKTWILEVRYLVRTGSWDRAWSRVITHGRQGRFPQTEKNTIPVPVWVEFFALPRRGVIGPQERTDNRRHEDEKGQHPAPTDPFPRSQLNSKLWNDRLRVLFDSAPKDLANLQDIQPHVIRGIVLLLLKLQHRDHALQLTKAYFQSLPRKLSPLQARYTTDILNLHVSFGSSSKGLQKLWDTKKLIRSLLHLHRALRPDSETLFLLLSPLQRAKRCGSTAQAVVEGFSRLYGEKMVDAQVMRRVIHLALKEGRHGIVEKYQRLAKKAARLARREELKRRLELPRKLLRLPRRMLFKREGTERFYWSRLRRRVRTRLQR